MYLQSSDHYSVHQGFLQPHLTANDKGKIGKPPTTCIQIVKINFEHHAYTVAEGKSTSLVSNLKRWVDDHLNALLHMSLIFDL